MNINQTTIDELIQKYIFLFDEKEILKLKNKLMFMVNNQLINNTRKIVIDEIKKYIEALKYDEKLSIINRYINNVLVDDVSIIDTIYNIVKNVLIISSTLEKDKMLFEILDNQNLKLAMYELITDDTIDLSNLKNDYNLDDFYLLFEMFGEENEIKIKYNQKIESDISDISKMYLKEMGQIPLLSDEETEKLFLKVNENDEKARNKIVESNLRLVVSIAGRFYSMYKVFDFNDLIQEGNIALINATSNYKLNMNCRFSTYAVNCINNHLKRTVLNNNRNVSYPVGINADIKKIKNVVSYLQNKYLRKPTTLEIANELKFKEAYVKYLLALNNYEISLNTKLSLEDGDEASELIDYLIDNNVNVENEAINNIVRNEIKNIISSFNISERDLYIFLSCNDLGLNEKEKLRTLGEKYNVTHEAVRQISERVRRKLMRDLRLQYYYDEDGFYFNNKYKVEFMEEKNINKFNSISKLKFKDGISMPCWFYKNKLKIEKGISDVELKIIEQYKEYIKTKTEELKLTLVKK